MQPDQISSDDHVIVSKYIADPLCIDGHKCDVRLYVAVTSFDPLLIYLYEEGLVRLATVKYDKQNDNLWNPCMHLCNYSINKYHTDYIKSTDSSDDVGHKWTFSALLRHLKYQGCDTVELMLNIEDVIVKSILSCAQPIVSACRMFVPSGNNCFELFGFDILIDDTLKPWLLEINLSPSLGIDTPLDARVKSSVMADLLTLIGMPALSPEVRATYESKWNRYKNGPVPVTSRKVVSSENISGTSTVKRNTTNNTTTTASTTTNTGSGSNSSGHTSTFLTTEELRIVRNANAQYDRRGGFVRIFPVADSMLKYGHILDPVTGIPIASPSPVAPCSMILPHNYNQLLFQQLFPGKMLRKVHCVHLAERVEQYERVLHTTVSGINLMSKSMNESQNVDEARRLRQQIRRLIENGNEMSHFQARRAFQQYLESVLHRLMQEPRTSHEKYILKFITLSNPLIQVPSFMRNQQKKPHMHQTVPSKDRSALVSKLLGDYLEQYARDTDAYVDDYDRPGIIPRQTFDIFLAAAQESDLESVLTLHTNRTQSIPFLYNRCSDTFQPPPPIRTGQHGFLSALPSMPANSLSRMSTTKIDWYYKSVSNIADEQKKDMADGGGGATDKVMSTSTTLPAVSCRSAALPSIKKRSQSQSAVNGKR